MSIFNKTNKANVFLKHKSSALNCSDTWTTSLVSRICWSFSTHFVHTCTRRWTLLVSGHSTVDADLGALLKCWVLSSSHSLVFQRNCRGAEVAGRSMQTDWSDFLRTTLILQPESRLCVQCMCEKSLGGDSNSWYPLEKGFHNNTQRQVVHGTSFTTKAPIMYNDFLN